jgi:hypothetical protein
VNSSHCSTDDNTPLSLSGSHCSQTVQGVATAYFSRHSKTLFIMHRLCCVSFSCCLGVLVDEPVGKRGGVRFNGGTNSGRCYISVRSFALAMCISVAVCCLTCVC